MFSVHIASSTTPPAALEALVGSEVAAMVQDEDPGDEQDIITIPEEAEPMEGLLSEAAAKPTLRRSPRLAKLEEPTHMTILDKATSFKKTKLEGKRGPSRLGRLPAKELLDLASKGPDPLGPVDIGLLAKACDAVADVVTLGD
jgi:hypothetical protein